MAERPKRARSGLRTRADVVPRSDVPPGPEKRANRTYRASDPEFAVVETIRRTLYLDGRLPKIADTSEIIRCALRLAAKMPVDMIVTDLLEHTDQEDEG